ncbi:hypothetical protein [Streptomyces griseus]|uniref:hypothetical protein n=1 Tax=Streptomyces griseus TaxID=1911 RepID=UPI00131AC34B|nr:hypothetical protein [Streptomyces griseus]
MAETVIAAMGKLLISRRIVGRPMAFACAATIALTACGENSAPGSRLSLRETQSVLPDSTAVPGWRIAAPPAAYPAKKALSSGLTNCYTAESCKNVLFSGRSVLREGGKPEISFLIFTYQDAATAKSSYTPVWKAWTSRVPGARELNLGKIGDQNDAVSGADASFASGSKSILSQVRVGSVILLTHGAAAPKMDMKDSLIKRFATMFSERAQQAQDSKAPSASLRAAPQ